MPPVKILWGERILAARKAAGLTQSQLAVAAGVQQQRISYWEKGRGVPRDHNRIRLARALGVDPAELFAYPEQPDDENGWAA